MKLPANKIESVASKEASRYTLQAIKVDVDQKRLLATDGYIAAIVPVEVSPEDQNSLVSLDTIKAIRAMQKRSKGLPVTINVNGKVIAECVGERVEHASVEGTFPNIDAVIPKVEGPPTISFNVDLLRRLSEALHCSGDNTCVSLWVRDANSAILVKSTQSDDKDCIGVLMPVRA